MAWRWPSGRDQRGRRAFGPPGDVPIIIGCGMLTEAEARRRAAQPVQPVRVNVPIP
jgi:hypothetical protein